MGHPAGIFLHGLEVKIPTLVAKNATKGGAPGSGHLGAPGTYVPG
jgi:hypothetical protein